MNRFRVVRKAKYTSEIGRTTSTSSEGEVVKIDGQENFRKIETALRAVEKSKASDKRMVKELGGELETVYVVEELVRVRNSVEVEASSGQCRVYRFGHVQRSGEVTSANRVFDGVFRKRETAEDVIAEDKRRCEPFEEVFGHWYEVEYEIRYFKTVEETTDEWRMIEYG